jgi:hypothetical protein
MRCTLGDAARKVRQRFPPFQTDCLGVGFSYVASDVRIFRYSTCGCPTLLFLVILLLIYMPLALITLLHDLWQAWIPSGGIIFFRLDSPFSTHPVARVSLQGRSIVFSVTLQSIWLTSDGLLCGQGVDTLHVSCLPRENPSKCDAIDLSCQCITELAAYPVSTLSKVLEKSGWLDSIPPWKQNCLVFW